MSKRREIGTTMDMKAAFVLSAANKAKAVKDVRTIVIERQWTPPFDFHYFCWCVADGKILDSFPTSELVLVDRWLADHGLSSDAEVWRPL